MSSFPSPPPPASPPSGDGRGSLVSRTVAVLLATVLLVAYLATYAALRRADPSAAGRLSAGSSNGRSGEGRWPGSGSGSGAGLGPQSIVNAGQVSEATARQGAGLVRIATASTYDGSEAAGTGMVLTAGGEVLTNNHVVEGATAITATVMSTGRTYSARVLGTDVRDDVAVLQLTGAGGLATVTTSTSTSPVRVGDEVTAVGDAAGAERHLTAARGAVTGLGRSVTTRTEGAVTGERLHGLLEVAADVVPGDSGGPLLDRSGQVVGMTTAASSGSAAVTGYAIPIGEALRIVRTVDSGTATARIHLGYNAFLGVELVSATIGTGVAAVEPGTPADRLGLAAGDTIITVDGRRVATAAALRRAIAAHRPGDLVTLTWSDAVGAGRTGTVTLARGPVA